LSDRRIDNGDGDRTEDQDRPELLLDGGDDGSV
jgi:hypothetical protein